MTKLGLQTFNELSMRVNGTVAKGYRPYCCNPYLPELIKIMDGCFVPFNYTGFFLGLFFLLKKIKFQPLTISCRCGSHDHHLYALDYKNHCCVYKFPCGGSIYGSPAIDEVKLLPVT